jgi:LPXTG-motif cell wall-anchored protein
MSNYLSEFRTGWRPLLAATIGIGTGMSIAGTVTSTIAPHLIEGNGWSMAEFAAVGGLGFVSSLAFPFIGRLADVLGVRLTALIGQVTLPLAYLAYSLMDGSLSTYIAIFVVQSILCVTTTATVYTRLAVQYFEKARGLALAVVVSGSAITGFFGAPVLNAYVEEFGWRASYQALAIFATIAAIIVFALIPSGAGKGMTTTRRSAREDYPMIFRSAAFWILAGAMLLCNLPQVLILTQTKLLALENGVSAANAGIVISALTLGMFAGRFVAGVALDRYQPYMVAFTMLAIPSLGLFVIASPFDGFAVILASVFCLGFAFGAEGDLVAFLVAKRFGVEVYSSVMGLLTAVMSGSASLGAILLSVTLAQTGNFNLFLLVAGVAVFAGAALILLLRRGEGQAPVSS